MARAVARGCVLCEMSMALVASLLLWACAGDLLERGSPARESAAVRLGGRGLLPRKRRAPWFHRRWTIEQLLGSENPPDDLIQKEDSDHPVVPPPPEGPRIFGRAHNIRRNLQFGFQNVVPVITP